MSYLGETLSPANTANFSWERTHLIVVSGSELNFCGHTLLNAGRHYFHVDGVHGKPWVMDEAGYVRYLSENGKTELHRQWIPMPNPMGAEARLRELAHKRWLWAVLPHNCAAYVEELLSAGGSTTHNMLNCPTAPWANLRPKGGVGSWQAGATGYWWDKPRGATGTWGTKANLRGATGKW